MLPMRREGSPLSPQPEVGFAVSNVPDQMCHLCGALHHTGGEMVLFPKVKNGPRSDGTNRNLKAVSLCEKNQPVAVILEEKNSAGWRLMSFLQVLETV